MNRRDVLKTSALFMGYAVSVSALTETFIACSKQVALDWKPVFLTNNQANLVAEITETILPKTATPGAKELGVPQFVDKMLKDLLSEADQKSFLAGLDALDEQCNEKNGKSFVDCAPAQREAFLLALDKEGTPPPLSLWGITLEEPKPQTFFRQLKGLTLLGYYTSEKVGKEILSYDPIPGEFIACMPLKPEMNAWNE